MIAFMLRHIALTFPILIVMRIVVFMIIRLAPGDPVRNMLGFGAIDTHMAELRHQQGLSRSLIRK